ncbi:MAG: hypothetical protein JWQ60_1833 [Pseudonocardia sp.]|nr:hypothetical protein [Pseudonocardia sp.]
MQTPSRNRFTAVAGAAASAAVSAPLFPAGLLALAALTTVALARAGGLGRAADPVLALVDPSPSGSAAALRAVLLAATAATAGTGLVASLVAGGTGGRGRPAARGMRVVAWVGGLVASGACAVEVLTGGASRPLAVAQVVVSLLVPLLLGTGRPVTAAPAALVLAGLLGVELGTMRTGLPLVVDVVFAVAGAVLFGSCVHGIGARTAPGSDSGTDSGTGSDSDTGDPGERRGLVRPVSVAVPAGLVTTIAGVGQLALTGPPAGYDMLHTGYGLAALTQAIVPLLVTATWLVIGRPAGRVRVGELSRLCAGGVVVAVAAAAVLATLPHPAAAPVPGRPLARPVELPFQHLAVLVAPMRPGPNLVHIAATPAVAGSQAAGHHHGVPAPTGPAGTITVSAGGAAVPVVARPGAPGGWAVLDIPAGVDRITVTDDGSPATVPVDVGDDPAEPALQQALTGPDGPECASALLGGLVAGSTAGRDGAGPTANTAECPSQRLAAADGDALRDSVTFLAGRRVTGLNLVSDDSPRATAAAELVRAQAASLRLPVRDVGVPTDTLLVVSGWSAAVPALRQAVARSADEPAGGIVLAPWLATGAVISAAPSEVLPLLFNPGESPARQYGATVAAVFPGEGPSTAGYLAWLRAGGAGGPLDGRATFYGAAPVDVPMGMDDMDMGGNPGDWYPTGTIVPINPPVGPAGAKQ